MSARVLVVDDDTSNRITMAALLEDSGFFVVEAVDIDEAIAAAPQGFDVVLLDRHLGDMDALDALPDLRRSLGGARIVLVTGDLSGANGVDGLLEKGGRFELVLETVEKMIAR